MESIQYLQYRSKITIICQRKNFLRKKLKITPLLTPRKINSLSVRIFHHNWIPPAHCSTLSIPFRQSPEIPEIYIHPEEETFDTRYSKVQKEIKKKNQREKSRNNTRQINGKRKSFSQPSSLPSFLRLLLSTRRSNFSIPFDRFFNTSGSGRPPPAGVSFPNETKFPLPSNPLSQI